MYRRLGPTVPCKWGIICIYASKTYKQELATISGVVETLDGVRDALWEVPQVTRILNTVVSYSVENISIGDTYHISEVVSTELINRVHSAASLGLGLG